MTASASCSRRRIIATPAARRYIPHEWGICGLLRHRHGAAERGQRVIMHGTMCLIRRAAIEHAGGWSSDTIVEDTDLGLAILEHGWLAHYTSQRYGHGLLPDTFEAYKRQRHRWAFGGSQLCASTGGACCLGPRGLLASKSANYAIGWLNWLGSDAIGLVVALLNIVWVPWSLSPISRCRTIFSPCRSSPPLPSRSRILPRCTAARGASPAADDRRRMRSHGAAMDSGARGRHGHHAERMPFLRTAKGGNSRKGAGLPRLLGSGDRRACS